jgi:ankyrin repeat protein
MAEILRRNGADLKAQEGSGKTPLDLAKALERSAITTLVRQALDQDVNLQVSSEVEESQPQPLTTKEYPTQQVVSDDYPADVYLGKHAEES